MQKERISFLQVFDVGYNLTTVVEYTDNSGTSSTVDEPKKKITVRKGTYK